VIFFSDIAIQYMFVNSAFASR